MQSGDLSKGGGLPRLMPSYVLRGSNVFIKIDSTAGITADNAAFYTTLGQDFTDLGFETAIRTTAMTTATTEQDIMDTGIGNKGVVTQIKSSLPSGAPVDMIIRIYIDSNAPIVITEEFTQANEALCIGDFLPWTAVATNIAAGYGIGEAAGYGLSANVRNLLMLTPKESLTRGLIAGLVFEDRLRVTQQCALTAAGTSSNGATVSWLNSIPVGA